MGRIAALCLIVLAIWAAAEIYTKGIDDAFGGMLASADSLQRAGTTSQRASGAFQRAYNKSESRVDGILERQPEYRQPE